MKNKNKLLMSKLMLPLTILLLFHLSIGCTGQVPSTVHPENSKKNNPAEQTINTKSIENDTIPSSIEQEKLRPQEPNHQYGDIILKPLGGTYSLLRDGRQIIREEHPGILIYDQPKGEQHTTNWKIEFYDISTKKLKKQINLEKTSPYRQEKYKKIEFGGFGGSDSNDEAPPSDSSRNYSNLPSPDNYRTDNLVTLSSGGHICVRHELYKLAGNMLVGFELTVVIYDSSGQEIRSMLMNHSVESPYISRDGKYFAFIYGTHTTDNLFDDWNGNLIIYELKLGKKVLHYVFDHGERIRNMNEVERDGLLCIKSRAGLDHSHVSKIVLIDLYKRELYQRQFSKPEWSEALKSWKSYTGLVQKYQFTSKNF